MIPYCIVLLAYTVLGKPLSAMRDVTTRHGHYAVLRAKTTSWANVARMHAYIHTLIAHHASTTQDQWLHHVSCSGF